MKNLSTIRNGLIMILCCTVVCMGIGFIVLSLELKKEKEKEDSFHVVFSKIEKTSSVKGSNAEPKGKIEIVNQGLELDMEFQLKAVHDEVTYLATIHNDSSMTAQIIGIVESPDYSEERYSKLITPIVISHSDVEGKILPPGEDTTLKITVYYPPGKGDFNGKIIPYRIGLLSKSYS